MLPFTTYNIPESPEKETLISAKWLWIITGKPLLAPEEELLLKICSALKADFLVDVHVRELQSTDTISLSSLSEDIRLIISFGVPPSALGIWIDLPNAGIRFMETYCFILTTPLSALNDSPVAKKQLWNAMQLFLETKS